MKWQTYAYDWLGNTTATDDDLQAFYDRSLGTVTNNGYQLSTASQTAGSKSGSLSTTYDAAGNLLSMDVLRNGPCTVTDGCTSQHYTYEWDEVGRLVKATRDAEAELIYTYDASDQRVRKSSGSRHTLYVFASLELRGAAHDGTNYEVTAATEVPFFVRERGTACPCGLARRDDACVPGAGRPSWFHFGGAGSGFGRACAAFDGVCVR